MNKPVRIVALFIIISILILGAIGLFFPGLYADFYISKLLSQSWPEYYSLNPETGTLIKVLFQANGLGMVMSGILAFFILIFSVMKGVKWGVIALLIVGLIGGIGEVLLEIAVFRCIIK